MWWNSSEQWQYQHSMFERSLECACVCFRKWQTCPILFDTSNNKNDKTKMPCVALTTLLTHISSLDDFELLFTASCTMHTWNWLLVHHHHNHHHQHAWNRIDHFSCIQLKTLVDVPGLFLFFHSFFPASNGSCSTACIVELFVRSFVAFVHISIIASLVSLRAVFFTIAFHILCVSTLYWVKLLEPGLCLHLYSVVAVYSLKKVRFEKNCDAQN